MKKQAPKILCVIPSLPEDLSSLTLKSVLKQSIPIEMLVVLPKKVRGKNVSAKVSKVLNESLQHIKIEHFDYILRVDGEVVLPPNFLEEALKEKPDLYGAAGYAMLIKVGPFLKVMKGRFHPESDDSYTCYKFMQSGCKFIRRYKVRPILLRKPGRHHGVRYYINRGEIMYKVGYEPFHVLISFRWDLWNIFAVFGYFMALLKRERKFDVAKFVWGKQVKRLFHL
ncbi:MAG: hypothetical protein ACTSV7_12790 [Candidatus Baldrarchaeia archaeon]